MATRRSPPSAAAEAPVDPRLFVASVEKALRVLGVFDREHPRLTLAEIAARTALGRSATQRFVYTLHRRHETLGHGVRTSASGTNDPPNSPNIPLGSGTSDIFGGGAGFSGIMFVWDPLEAARLMTKRIRHSPPRARAFHPRTASAPAPPR